MRKRRNRKEIEQLVGDFEVSGKTRTAYCRETGLALSTLGRYLKRRGGGGQRLVRIKLESAPDRTTGFALVLGNGRRIESGWNFGEAELALLIRIAEAM